MIGCAAEKALLQLIEAFGSALKDPAEKSKYEKDTKSWVISTKYKALWKRMNDKLTALPGHLSDDLAIILDRAYDLIRTTRNEAGHPTGKKLELDVVQASFVLFPGYCKRIYGLLDFLGSKTL